MSSANPLPPLAEQTLTTWLQDVTVSQALSASDWKSAFASYRYLEFQDAPPLASLSKPLSQARLSVITTGGIYDASTQAPFEAQDVLGDASIRLLDVNTPYERLKLAHDHYDHSVPEQDLSTINPTRNLQALVQEGFLGALDPFQISAQGYIPDWRRIFDKLVPSVLENLRQTQPDAALLVPV
jgi:hypothetical protein